MRLRGIPNASEHMVSFEAHRAPWPCVLPGSCRHGRMPTTTTRETRMAITTTREQRRRENHERALASGRPKEWLRIYDLPRHTGPGATPGHPLSRRVRRQYSGERRPPWPCRAPRAARSGQNVSTLSLSMTHLASAAIVDFSAPSKYGWLR
jgi:hypothetical protein